MAKKKNNNFFKVVGALAVTAVIVGATALLSLSQPQELKYAAAQVIPDPPTGHDYFILDDATGGDCEGLLKSTWDANTKTCTLEGDTQYRLKLASDNVTLDCNNYSQTSTVSPTIHAQGVNGVLIKNCNTNSYGTGIQLDGATNSTVINNTAYTTNSHAIADYGLSEYNTFEGNTVTRAGIAGIFIDDRVKGDVVINNTISATRNGLEIEGGNRDLWQEPDAVITLDGNSVTGASQKGIYLKPGSRIGDIINNVSCGSGEYDYHADTNVQFLGTIANNKGDNYKVYDRALTGFLFDQSCSTELSCADVSADLLSQYSSTYPGLGIEDINNTIQVRYNGSEVNFEHRNSGCEILGNFIDGLLFQNDTIASIPQGAVINIDHYMWTDPVRAEKYARWSKLFIGKMNNFWKPGKIFNLFSGQSLHIESDNTEFVVSNDVLDSTDLNFETIGGYLMDAVFNNEVQTQSVEQKAYYDLNSNDLPELSHNYLINGNETYQSIIAIDSAYIPNLNDYTHLVTPAAIEGILEANLQNSFATLISIDVNNNVTVSTEITTGMSTVGVPSIATLERSLYDLTGTNAAYIKSQITNGFKSNTELQEIIKDKNVYANAALLESIMKSEANSDPVFKMILNIKDDQGIIINGINNFAIDRSFLAETEDLALRYIDRNIRLIEFVSAIFETRTNTNLKDISIFYIANSDPIVVANIIEKDEQNNQISRTIIKATREVLYQISPSDNVEILEALIKTTEEAILEQIDSANLEAVIKVDNTVNNSVEAEIAHLDPNDNNIVLREQEIAVAQDQELAEISQDHLRSMLIASIEDDKTMIDRASIINEADFVKMQILDNRNNSIREFLIEKLLVTNSLNLEDFEVLLDTALLAGEDVSLITVYANAVGDAVDYVEIVVGNNPPETILADQGFEQLIIDLEEATQSGQGDDDADDDGILDDVDECANTAGSVEFNGCPHAVIADSFLRQKPFFWQKTNLEGQNVRLYDVENTDFDDWCDNTNPCKPAKSLYPDILASNVGLVNEGFTGPNGQVVLGVDHPGKYLVLNQYSEYDSAAGKDRTATSGRIINFFRTHPLPELNERKHDSLVDNTTTPADSVEKNIPFIKRVQRWNGQFKIYPASGMWALGSQLDIYYPDYVIWENETEYFPFIYYTEDDWDVDICMNAPEGYELTGILDEEENVVTTDSCLHAFVAGEEKVFLFELLDVDSPEPEFTFDFTATHDGDTTEAEIEMEGVREWTKEAYFAKKLAKIEKLEVKWDKKADKLAKKAYKKLDLNDELKAELDVLLKNLDDATIKLDDIKAHLETLTNKKEIKEWKQALKAVKKEWKAAKKALKEFIKENK